MTDQISLVINGRACVTTASRDTPLLYVLRNEFKLFAPKYGCGLGQCGACAVLIDDKPAWSCMLPISGLSNKKITTLEGLSGGSGALHPVQEAFIEVQASQCGYCTNGMVITTVALLQDNKQPSDEDIRKAFRGNLCRCGSHSRVMRAVTLASQKMK